MSEVLDEALKPSLLEGIPGWIHPDHITLVRGLCLTPLIIWGDDPIPAVGILIVSSVCDILDGSLARARRQTTRDGAALDAACDKVFLIGALLCVIYERVHPAFVWGVIAIDAVIALVRWRKRRYDVTQNSNPWGKRKTITLSVAIGLVLTKVEFLTILASPAFVIALCCAFMSLYGHYRELRTARVRK